MDKLRADEWTHDEDLMRLVAALGADNIRWVGGAVRDTLLRIPVADVDAATTWHPEQVIEKLKAAGIKSVPTGIAHGTITAVLPSGNVEVTTLRKDIATDGRRATVAFAEDWRDDAARRDFTINALYAHPETLEITDYFGGLDDLVAQRVRFIGDARARIQEDHLRILRYYRFQARFGSDLDPEAEEACAELAPMLKGLSRERVSMELLNIIDQSGSISTLKRMLERGVLPVILPETDSEGLTRLEALMAREEALGFAPSPLRGLAALLPKDPKIAAQVAARLRLSNAQRKHLVKVAELSDVPISGEGEADAKALAYREGMSIAIDLMLLSGADTASLHEWSIPQFPLKGGAIVARGVGAGPEVARILQAVEARWIAEGFPDAARVDVLLNEELGD